MTFLVEKLAEGIYIGRLLTRVVNPTYNQGVVITEEDGGETLFLRLWVGEPPSLSIWREASEKYFPSAERVRWLRMKNDVVREVNLKI